MNPRLRFKWIFSLFSFALLCVFIGAAGTWAAGSRPDTGKLTPRLAALAMPGMRAASRAEEAKTLSLPASGPGALMRHGQYLVVNIRVRDTSASTLTAISDAGARIIHVNNEYRIATVEIQPDSLQTVANLDEVESLMEEFVPARRSDLRGLPSPAGRSASSCSSPGGSVVSEGDTQLRAALARSTYGVDGSGVSVGILSDSFDAYANAATHAAQDVASGDLPGVGNPCGYTTPVNVLEEISGSDGEDEGRAMTQIVHDLAPGANLLFASAFNGLYSFADNIRNLQSSGAQIIADDVFYYDEPFYQDGPVSVAINDVTSSGALYYTAAGNQSFYLNGNNISGWEAPAFRPTKCPAAVGDSSCMDFDPGTGINNSFGITSGSGFTLVLQWNEPWNGVNTDFDLHVIKNGVDVASSTDNNATTGMPFEMVQVPSGSVSIVISRHSGTATPRLKFVLFNAWDISAFQYQTSSGGDIVGPNIVGHSDCANAMSVAAVPYNDSTKAESFSSMGPATHYWGPVSATGPAAALSTPQVLYKPDIAATDGGASTFFSQQVSGVWRFYGTSAAAPHAAAVAALMLDANPAATPSQVNGALEATARTVGSETTSRVGAGLIDADSSVGSVLGSSGPVVSSFKINNGAASTTSATVTLNNTVTGSTPTQYMASESSSFSGATWLAYSTAPSFTLSSGAGAKTVFFKVKDGSGTESGIASASITLTGPTVSSFTINNGAGSTTNPTVTLNNTVTGSTPTQYMASESPSFSGATWLTYSTAPSFTLSSGAGSKVVFFKVRNSSGVESAAANASISLTEAKPVVSSFKINNGAASTTNPTVTLNNTVTGSTPTQYMASESSSFSGAAWKTYSTAPSFTLSLTAGVKTVYFKVKNGSGMESAVLTDTISLTGPRVYSFKINNGAISTTSTKVRLNNTITGATPSQYMASESSSFTGATWLTYSTAPYFTLSSTIGTKTVYFKVKTASGVESAVVKDSITLAEARPVVSSFKINNGATSTTSTTVSLNNTVTGSTPTYYMASESLYFTGAAWMAYSTAPSFTLSSKSGVKTVYFKVKNKSGLISAVVRDTITH